MSRWLHSSPEGELPGPFYFLSFDLFLSITCKEGTILLWSTSWLHMWGTPDHSSSLLLRALPKCHFPRPQGGLSPMLMFPSTSVHLLSNTHTSVYCIQSQPGLLNRKLREASPQPRTRRTGTGSAHGQLPMNQHWLLRNMGISAFTPKESSAGPSTCVYLYIFFSPETIFLTRGGYHTDLRTTCASLGLHLWFNR